MTKQNQSQQAENPNSTEEEMVSYKNTIKLLLKKMESGPQNDQIILAIGKLKGALVRLQTKEKDNG